MEMYVDSKLKEATESLIERINDIYDLVPEHSN